MPKITVSLYGRDYQLSCPEGQERRVQDLAAFVEQRMRAVASNAGNTTENRLFMLTCMMLADEMMEMRETVRRPSAAQQAAHMAQQHYANEEDVVLTALARMQDRLDHLTAAVA